MVESLHPFVPFVIFLRANHEYSDIELLSFFGLSAYQRYEPATLVRPDCWVVLGDAGQWTMLADDYRYTLWFMKTTRPALELLAERHGVFWCCIGDCHLDVEFVFYQNGDIARRFEFYDDRGVKEDIGTPMAGEATLLKSEMHHWRLPLELPKSLGIEVDLVYKNLRIYGQHLDGTARRAAP